MNKILITGAAGFIGYFLTQELLKHGFEVVGLDNLNDYYDPGLKLSRLDQVAVSPKYLFVEADLSNRIAMEQVFNTHRFDIVINLAAQVGVRYSLENPRAYVKSNLLGFTNVLECCRYNSVKHLVFASSSSVYGGNAIIPFSTHDGVDHPVSFYAVTKRSNELMAHTYSHLYGLPTTGLRFFTVYGPWGRPDMSYFLFTRAILAGEPINIFNNGDMQRDFTYIDDVIKSIVLIMGKPPAPVTDWRGSNSSISWAPYRIYNIGNNHMETLMHFISVLEGCLRMKAKKRFLPMQDGDVVATCANIDDLVQNFKFKPSINIEVGLEKFVKWYRGYYGK